MITICAWCGKRRIEPGLWVREPEGMEHPFGTVSHGICPACDMLLENEQPRGENE
ncbi:MAG: hypothetical protein U9Q07_04130 [Planctomycetota bacterium]|nr:hypothetical protein [Planctomycetota bacterium]